MARIRWTPQAAEDLDMIAEYIAGDSPHYATLFVLKIISAVERLEQFPELAALSPNPTNRLFEKYF